MEKIRILALHLAYGGVEKAICSMANLFADRYEVEIVSVYAMPNAPAYEIDERVRVRYLLDDIPNREAWRQAALDKAPLSFIRESAKAVKILRDKKRAVREFICSVGDGILITTRHEDNLMLSKYGKSGVRKIAQLHHDHAFRKKYLRGFKSGYWNIDVFALLTPKLRDEVRAIMCANKHTQIVCIPNFIHILPETPAEQPRSKTVLAVGRLVGVKGFARLIESFKNIHRRYPDWKLKIVGDGVERKKLEKQIAEYGLKDYVILTGRLDEAGVLREMREASIYAMSSFSEGFALVLLEAFSCSLPCVAYDVRVGPASIIENGVSGLLVPDRDSAEFERCIAQLIENDERRKEMGHNAYKRAGDFSAEEVSKIWFEFL